MSDCGMGNIMFSIARDCFANKSRLSAQVFILTKQFNHNNNKRRILYLVNTSTIIEFAIDK
jgi:hypothetical protein